MAFDKVTYQRDLMRKRRGTKVRRTPVSKRSEYKTLHNANSYRARTSSHDATPFKISFSPGGLKATYVSSSSEYNLRLRIANVRAAGLKNVAQVGRHDMERIANKLAIQPSRICGADGHHLAFA